jgi:hypothetical protein
MTSVGSDFSLAETDRAPRPVRAEPQALFGSVVCVVDSSSTGHAARQQAAALAAGQEVEYIATSRPWSANSALLDRCDGADLLVLGARDDAGWLIERASLPVLLARWCPSGADVTERILVVVDDETEPHRAAEIAGQLASRYGGSVAVVPAPEPNRALERATAATSRIVLQAAGVVPRVFGERVPSDQAIMSAAAAMDASLLVLPLGNTERARRRAALIARLVGCSVLLIPVPAAGPEALAPSSGRPAWLEPRGDRRHSRRWDGAVGSRSRSTGSREHPA